MPLSFLAPSLPAVHPVRLHAPPTCSRKKRIVPQCVVKKILVVDLQELLRRSDAQHAPELKQFSERISVDRSSATNQTYVLFISLSGYDASMYSIRDAGLIEPDALATLSGTELYQRQYVTPDPYWASSVRGGWVSKPVQWAMDGFFKDEVDSVDTSEDFVVKVKCKGSSPSADFCKRVAEKLKEMGISVRVILGEDGRTVNIVPAAGSAADVVAFCQTALRVEEASTFVFGGDDLLNDCVQGKANVGFCGSCSEQSWELYDGRVYVSEEVGAKALMDGVLHHAIF